jgi:hypothetical protein
MVNAMIFHDDDAKPFKNDHFAIVGVVERRQHLPLPFSSFNPTYCTHMLCCFVFAIRELLKSPSKSDLCVIDDDTITLIKAFHPTQLGPKLY